MSSEGTRDGGSGRRSAAERSSNAGATPRRVDRTRFVPLYFQIAEILKDRIEAQTWRPGDRFPSERELIEEFGVSRTVVRPALALLESDGQLVRIKGRGTFVAPPKTPLAVQGLVRLLSRPLQDGVTLRILAMTERRPEPYVRDVLGIRRGRVRNITALAARDGVPMFLGDSFSVVDALPWLGRSLAGLPTFDTADGPVGE